MGAVKAIELAGIIYSTFENVRGSVISCQYPKDYVSAEQFKKITHAVIPRADLTQKPITIEEFNHFIIGFPQRIEGIQYKRNTLQFNICLLVCPQLRMMSHDDLTGRHFCLDSNSAGLRPAIQVAYELTVRKINRYLAYMEEEFLILSKQENGIEGVQLDSFLAQIWSDLRESGLSVATLAAHLPPLYLIFSPRIVNTSVTSYFVPNEDELVVSSPSFSGNCEAGPDSAMDILSHAPALPLAIHEVTDASVFVRIEPIGAGPNGGQIIYAIDTCSLFWDADDDLTSQRILPLVNGQRSVVEVSRLAMVDVNIVRLCLTQLAQVGAVRLISAPIFTHRRTSLPSKLNEQGEGPENEGVDEAIDEEALLFAVPGYIGLPRLLELTHSNPTLRDACLRSVLLPCSRLEIRTSEQATQVSFIILRIYSKLCGSPYLNLPYLVSATSSYAELVTPQTVISQCSAVHIPGVPKIDLLRLVQFGEVNNLIQRLRCYPISNVLREEAQKTPTKTMSSVATPRARVPSSLRPGRKSSDIELDQLQTSLWNMAHSKLMDGTSSVDHIVFALSRRALQSIQSLNDHSLHPNQTHPHAQPRGQEWMPSRFSTLPDAIVDFNMKLLALNKQAEEENEESCVQMSSEDNFDRLNFSMRRRSSASITSRPEVDKFIPKVYLLWH